MWLMISISFIVNIAFMSTPVCAELSTYAYLPDQLSAKSDQLLNITEGQIPDYINGYLIQYQCGAFGNLKELPTSQDEWEDLSSISFIPHLFDCMSMMVRYDLTDDTNIYYSAQYLETKPYIIWKSNNFDMSISTLAWDTLYSTPDGDGFKDFYYYGGYRIQPNRQLWQLDGTFYAVGYNYTYFVEVDPYGLETLDIFSYDDDNIGFNSFAAYTPQLVMQSSFSHEDWAGTVYSVLCVFNFESEDAGTYEWVLYKIVDGKRTTVTSYIPDENTFDYGECDGEKSLYINTVINDFIVVGYYIILPVLPVVVDYCALLAREIETGDIPTAQSFYDMTSWSETNNVQFVVIHLDDDMNLDTVVTTVLTDNNFYILHIVNSYMDNDDSEIVIDLMLANSSEIMKDYFNVSNIVNPEDNLSYQTKLRRLTLGVDDASYSFQLSELYFQDEEIVIMYPTINPFWSNFTYQYIYFVYNPYKIGSYIIKIDLNADTDSDEIRTQWPDPALDYIITSPLEFIPNPTGTDEEDGVLVFNVVNSNDGMGYLAFLDAATMTDPTLTGTFNQSTVVISSHFYYADEIPITGLQEGAGNIEATVWLTVVFVLVTLYTLLLM